MNRKPRLSELCTSAVTVWFDPGVTTGWSVMSVHPESLVNHEYPVLSNIEHWTHGQIDCGHRRGLSDVRDIFDGEGRLEYSDLAVNLEGENEGISEMLRIVDDWPGASVGLEDFIVRSQNSSRDTVSPIRMTAGFDYGMFIRGYQTFRQQPSEAKALATDERLKAWNLYERAGGMNHARDADRHAITWLRKCKMRKNLREAAWPHLYGKMQVLDKITQQYVTTYGPYYIPNGKTWEWVLEREEIARKKQEHDDQIAEEVRLKIHSSSLPLLREVQAMEHHGSGSEAAGQATA